MVWCVVGGVCGVCGVLLVVWCVVCVVWRGVWVIESQYVSVGYLIHGTCDGEMAR